MGLFDMESVVIHKLYKLIKREEKNVRKIWDKGKCNRIIKKS